MIFYPKTIKSKNPAILFIHGWKGDQEGNNERAQPFVEKGYICMTFDLRGHGKEQGNRDEFSLKDFLDDTVKAYDGLVSLSEVDKENISVVGASMGAYLAILLSSKRNVSRLALRVPADYPNEWFSEPLGKMFLDNIDTTVWKSKVRGPQETFSLVALNNFKGLVLVVESGDDNTIPHQAVINYINAVYNRENLTYVSMENAPHHLDDINNTKFVKILLDWFNLS